MKYAEFLGTDPAKCHTVRKPHPISRPIIAYPRQNCRGIIVPKIGSIGLGTRALPSAFRSATPRPSKQVFRRLRPRKMNFGTAKINVPKIAARGLTSKGEFWDEFYRNDIFTATSSPGLLEASSPPTFTQIIKESILIWHIPSNPRDNISHHKNRLQITFPFHTFTRI